MQCDSCGIQIGPDYMEKTAYHVGKYSICGWCYDNLRDKGHVELDGRKRVAGQGMVCNWLYPDGSTKPMKIIATKDPPDIFFAPLNEPVSGDIIMGEEDDDQSEV